MTAATTTVLVPIQPVFSDAERLALAGFLAGYRGLTRDTYALDLRQRRCRAGHAARQDQRAGHRAVPGAVRRAG